MVSSKKTAERKTVFRAIGFKETIAIISQQVKDLYLSDEVVPWEELGAKSIHWKFCSSASRFMASR